MESGEKFFTAKNLVFLNKQVKAMYNRKQWKELDDALPSLVREWCDNFSNFRISDDLRVLNSEFLNYMSTFFKMQLKDSVGVDTDGGNVNKFGNAKNNKYAGEFMTIKDPFLEYQNTHYTPAGIDPRDERKSRNIFGDMKLGEMPVFNMLNGEEKYFLNQAFDIGAKSMRRNDKQQTDKNKIYEDYLKDSLETGHGRKFYKLDENLLEGFYRDENKFYDTFDPRAPGTVYDLRGVVPRVYTNDQTPYVIQGQNLTNPRNERRYINAYAGAKY